MKNLSLFKGWLMVYCTILCFINSPTFAISHSEFSKQQQTTITGTVTADGMPMAGVLIAVAGKKATAISNEYGTYSINANYNDTLLFSYVGFTTVLEPVNGRTHINVTLKKDATALQEVTVNAGYYSVKESERTGSIAKITAKDIEKQPVTNVLATMQGRMAGVSVGQETGVPGGNFSIKIRGQNSLREDGNAPLYVIDGVPYAADPIGFQQTSTILAGMASPLSSINPDDIESLEILKDADATAIYGSRGANGVVLITTKKGKAEKTRYSVTASSGWGHVTGKMDLMDTQQYLAMRRKAFANDGIEPSEYDYDLNGKWDQNRYTDWQEELIGGTAEIRGLQGSVSGGNEATQFLLSGNFRSESTVFPGDFLYKKGTFHSSVNHTSGDKRFKINFSGSYTAQDNNQSAADLTRDALLLAPNAPALYQDDGNLNWENGTFMNPLAASNGEYNAKTYDVIANTVLHYNLLENLQIKSSFGYSDLKHGESRSFPSTMYNPAFGIGPQYSALTLNNTGRRSWIVEPQVNWNRNVGKGKVELLFGGTFQQQVTDRLIQRGSGFTSNSLIYDMASASNILVYSNQETVYKYQAFYARANLGWQQKYFVNFTARRDGSSRFGPGHQFATFGAVGAAWLFSKEGFIERHAPAISFGKLRASYGTTGSDQIGDYQFLDTYTSSGTSYQGVNGLQPSRLYNPDFGWETNRKFESALEVGFLNDRIFLTVAWYRNRSSSQLVGIPLPGTTGFASLQANLDATVENSGREFTLRTVNVQGKNWNWSSSINFTVPKTKLVSFPGLDASPYKDQYVIGKSLSIQKLFHCTGIDPQTGVYTFADVNGDGKVSYPDDAQTVCDFAPEYYGGVQNQVSYKGLQLDFLFQFVKQRNFGPEAIFPVAGTMYNQPSQKDNAWQQAGDASAYQLYTTGVDPAAVTAFGNYAYSDAAVADASFIRLKNVALWYDLPLALKELKCRLMLQGQNLLTITSYKGLDPEFRFAGYLPPLRVITAGVQLQF